MKTAWKAISLALLLAFAAGMQAQTTQMTVEVGKADNAAAGNNYPVTGDRTGAMMVNLIRPEGYEATYRGTKFSATCPAAATAVTATAALCVYINPPGSGKLLVLTDATVGLTAYTAQTLACTSIMLGGSQTATIPGTVGTAITPVNTNIGNGNVSVVKAYVSATLGVAPVAVRQLGGWCLGTATPGADVTGTIRDEIKGQVIVQPGYAIAIAGLGGTPANLTIQPTLTWDEIPVAQVP